MDWDSNSVPFQIYLKYSKVPLFPTRYNSSCKHKIFHLKGTQFIELQSIQKGSYKYYDVLSETYHNIYKLNCRVAMDDNTCMRIFTAHNKAFHTPSFGLNNCICIKNTNLGTLHKFTVSQLEQNFKNSLPNIPHSLEVLRYLPLSNMNLDPSFFLIALVYHMIIF